MIHQDICLTEKQNTPKKAKGIMDLFTALRAQLKKNNNILKLQYVRFGQISILNKLSAAFHLSNC